MPCKFVKQHDGSILCEYCGRLPGPCATPLKGVCATAPPLTEGHREPRTLFEGKFMDIADFRQAGYQMIDWICKYRLQAKDKVVRSQVNPGFLIDSLPTHAPEEGENWDQIMQDMDEKIVPALTHWEHPDFFAYFKPYCSFPSVLGELACAGINAMGFSWIASPACTELEMITLDWFGRMLNLPEIFMNNPATSSDSKSSLTGKGGGVIQGSAGEAAIVAMLAAKAKKLDQLNCQTDQERYQTTSKLVFYVSSETHSILEKARRVVGIHGSRIRRIQAVKANDFAITADQVKVAIEEDLKQDLVPFFCCLTMGTTSSTAMDSLQHIAPICREHNVWIHVDAAYGGSYCVCPELRHYFDGIELCDSLCINAHKGLLTSFDLSCLWFQDSHWVKLALMLPSDLEEYLRNDATESGKVIDYKDWQLPLGRRFRSLKLWFVLRSFGVLGIQTHLRRKIKLAQSFEEYVENEANWEVYTPRTLSLVCFRFIGGSSIGSSSRSSSSSSDNDSNSNSAPEDPRVEELNAVNKCILDHVNASGKLFLVHTKLDGVLVLRLACGGLEMGQENVDNAWKSIKQAAEAVVQA